MTGRGNCHNIYVIVTLHSSIFGTDINVTEAFVSAWDCCQ